MISILFKEIKTGQLRRMAFFGYWLLLALIMMGLMLAMVFAIGAGEQLMDGELTQAQDQLHEWFSLPAMIIFIGFMAVMSFAQLNIVAKRIRHMGLPGWWVLLAIVVVKLVLNALLGEEAANIAGLIVALAVLFVPGGAFSKNT